MAIVYFLPDREKLIRSHNGANSEHNPNTTTNSHFSYHGNNNGNCSNDNCRNKSNALVGDRPQATTSATATNSSESGNDSGSCNTLHYKFSTPLNPFALRHTSSADVGCWQLITQVFCYALRFCNENKGNTNSCSSDCNCVGGSNSNSGGRTILTAPLIQVTMEVEDINSKNVAPTVKTVAQQHSTL